jgi:hypothetical protein
MARVELPITSQSTEPIHNMSGFFCMAFCGKATSDKQVGSKVKQEKIPNGSESDQIDGLNISIYLT